MMEEFVIKVFLTPLNLIELLVVIGFIFLVGAIGWGVINLITWFVRRIVGRFN